MILIKGSDRDLAYRHFPNLGPGRQLRAAGAVCAVQVHTCARSERPLLLLMQQKNRSGGGALQLVDD